MADHGTKWILAVRKLITDSKPSITVGELVQIFLADSPQMDLLHECYMDLKTPEQAFAALVKKYPLRGN